MRLRRLYHNGIFVLIVSGLMLMIIAACSSPAPTMVATPESTATRVIELMATIESTPTATVMPTPTPTMAWPETLPVQMGTVVPIPNEPISMTNVSRIVEVARWRKEGLKDARVARYSPDGKLLAVGTWTGIYLYDTQTMELIKHIDTGERIISLAFSPDGSLLASGPEAMSAVNLTMYSTDTWEVKRKLGVSQNSIGDIAFSPDGSLIAAPSSEDVKIWNVNDAKVVKTLKGDAQDAYGSAGSLAFSPDGVTMAVGLSGGTRYMRDKTITLKSALQIWDIGSEKVLRTFEVPNDTAITGVAFSPDGASIAAGIQIGGVNDYTQRDKATGAMRLWRVRDGALLQDFEGLARAVGRVSFSPDGSLLASSSGRDGEVRLWQVKDGSSLAVLQDDNSGRDIGGSIDFSPDGRTIALASNSVRIWQVSDGSLQRKIGGETSLGGRVMFSPDGSQLVVRRGVIQVSNGTLITTTDISAFSPDGSMMVTDKVVRLSDGAILFTLPYTTANFPLIFSPDGSLLAAASMSLDRVDVWQTDTWDKVHSIEFPTSTYVGSLSFSPDGTLLALGYAPAERIMDDGGSFIMIGRKGIVQIWNVKDQELVKTLC